MPLPVLPSLTALVLGMATLWSVPAAATDTSKALSICVSRGTDCSVTNVKGGYNICVNNSGGKQCVTCPALTEKDQTCAMALTKGHTGITSVLRGSATKLKVSQ